MTLTMQESGGRSLDIMQSSESIGLPPNSITDPERSIEVGIKHFKKVFKQAGGDSFNFTGIQLWFWIYRLCEKEWREIHKETGTRF